MNRIKIKWFLLESWIESNQIFHNRLNHKMNRFIFLGNLIESWIESNQFQKDVKSNQLTKLESCDGRPSCTLLLSQIQVIYRYIGMFRLVNYLNQMNHESNQNQMVFAWFMNRIESAYSKIIWIMNWIESLYSKSFESWVESIQMFLKATLNRCRKNESFTYMSDRRIQVPKKGRHCWPPTFSTLAPPMDEKYYCNRCIAFHCHPSRKFRIHLASIAVANSNLFCIFYPHIQWPVSAYDFWIFKSDQHMWITYPFPIECHLLDQNRFTNVPVISDQKCTWNSWFLPPSYLPPFYEFLKFLFLEM